MATPYEGEWSKAVYHLYVIRTGKRDKLKEYLAGENIDAGLHYPVPLHQQKAYATKKSHNGSLAVSERVAGEILSLPMFPGLTEEQQKRVVSSIKGFMEHSAERREQLPEVDDHSA